MRTREFFENYLTFRYKLGIFVFLIKKVLFTKGIIMNIFGKGIYPYSEALWLSPVDIERIFDFLYFSADAFDKNGALNTKTFSRAYVIEALADFFVDQEFLENAYLVRNDYNKKLVSMVDLRRKLRRSTRAHVLIYDFLDDERYRSSLEEMRINKIYTIFDIRKSLSEEFGGDKIQVISGASFYYVEWNKRVRPRI